MKYLTILFGLCDTQYGKTLDDLCLLQESIIGLLTILLYRVPLLTILRAATYHIACRYLPYCVPLLTILRAATHHIACHYLPYCMQLLTILHAATYHIACRYSLPYCVPLTHHIACRYSPYCVPILTILRAAAPSLERCFTRERAVKSEAVPVIRRYHLGEIPEIIKL